MILSWPLSVGALLSQLFSTSLAAVTVSTFSVTGDISGDDGPERISFALPYDVAIDDTGNVYVAESGNDRIRKITPEGVVSIVAGAHSRPTRGTSRSNSQLTSVDSITVDPSGNLYVTSWNSNKIRKVTQDGEVTTFAGTSSIGYVDGPVEIARFRNPKGLDFDSHGNMLIADSGNHCIRKITPEGIVSTLAGGRHRGFRDGPGAQARFDTPRDVAVDSHDNVYVSDWGNHCIRKIAPNGTVTTLAGSGTSGFREGPGHQARFRGPAGIVVGADGLVFVADWDNHRIRQITPNGFVSTVAGDGRERLRNGPGQSASFSSPMGIAIDSDGNLLVADTVNHLIRKITFTPVDDHAIIVEETDQDSDSHSEELPIITYPESDEDIIDYNTLVQWLDDLDGIDGNHSNNGRASAYRDPVPPRPIHYNQDECAICYEAKAEGDEYDYCSMSCGNSFHKRCITRCMSRRTQRKCPMCRAEWIMNKPPVAIPTASPDDE